MHYDVSSPLFLILILTGPIFILAGIALLIFPPKSVNALYGYRTTRSMVNKEAWQFAQAYSARLMIICGIALSLMAFSSTALPSLSRGVALSIGLGLTVVMAIIPIVITERKLKKNYPKLTQNSKT